MSGLVYLRSHPFSYQSDLPNLSGVPILRSRQDIYYNDNQIKAIAEGDNCEVPYPEFEYSYNERGDLTFELDNVVGYTWDLFCSKNCEADLTNIIDYSDLVIAPDIDFPQVINGSAGGVLSGFYDEYSGARCVYHIQDYWNRCCSSSASGCEFPGICYRVNRIKGDIYPGTENFIFPIPCNIGNQICWDFYPNNGENDGSNSSLTLNGSDISFSGCADFYFGSDFPDGFVITGKNDCGVVTSYGLYPDCCSSKESVVHIIEDLEDYYDSEYREGGTLPAGSYYKRFDEYSLDLSNLNGTYIFDFCHVDKRSNLFPADYEVQPGDNGFGKNCGPIYSEEPVATITSYHSYWQENQTVYQGETFRWSYNGEATIIFEAYFNEEGVSFFGNTISFRAVGGSYRHYSNWNGDVTEVSETYDPECFSPTGSNSICPCGAAPDLSVALTLCGETVTERLSYQLAKQYISNGEVYASFWGDGYWHGCHFLPSARERRFLTSTTYYI